MTDVEADVVALGNVFPVGPQDTETAEIAVIVDAGWHGRGVGSLLTNRLIDVARRMGFARLTAYVLADNRSMLGLLHATDLTWVNTPDHDLGSSVVCLTAQI